MLGEVCSDLDRLRVADGGPEEMFLRWRQDAREAGVIMPDSAVIATCSRSGVVSARTVCFRRMERGQFVFLTDSRSKKCRELAENPVGAVAFFWAFKDKDGRRFRRQVRVEGAVRALPRSAYEDLYWGLIPNRRVRAYICEQGSRADWDLLKQRHDELLANLDTGRELPMPDHFVAYEILPTTIEFNENADTDLLEHVLYTKSSDGTWIERHAEASGEIIRT